MRYLLTKFGMAILIVLAMSGIAVTLISLREQNLIPTPPITVQRVSAPAVERCLVGQVCHGPTVRSKDPEGERITYRFYDQLTKKPLTEPMTVESGEAVTPTFTFVQPGEKRLYMVVQDDAGHAAPDYPIIISVVK